MKTLLEPKACVHPPWLVIHWDATCYKVIKVQAELGNAVKCNAVRTLSASLLTSPLGAAAAAAAAALPAQQTVEKTWIPCCFRSEGT
jgi:hypothetical protein